MTLIKPHLAATAIIMAVAPTLALADDHIPVRPSMTEMAVDLTQLDGSFEIDFADASRLELLSTGRSRYPSYGIAVRTVAADAFGDMTFGGPVFMGLVRDRCDQVFEGTCEHTIEGEGEEMRISMRVERERQEQIALQTERFIDNTFITVTAYLPDDGDEALAEQNLEALLAQAIAYVLP